MDLVPCDKFEWQRVILRCASLDPTEKHLALTIAIYADYDGTRIMTGTERLTRVTGRSKSVVIRARGRLRDLGLIERVGERQKNGRRGGHDEYRLTYPADILSSMELLDPDEERVSSTTPVPA